MTSGFNLTFFLIGHREIPLCNFCIWKLCHHIDAEIFYFTVHCTLLWISFTKQFMEMTEEVRYRKKKIMHILGLKANSKGITRSVIF